MNDVTVIINTYNENSDYLIQAIDSYIMQEKVDLQLIVSTVKDDNSINTLKNYKNIDWCINDRPGIYYQLNNACKLIKNEWFCYASSNDIACQNKIYNEIECCKKNNRLICYSSFYVTNENLTINKVRTFHNYDYNKHLKGNFVSDCSLIHNSILKEFLPFRNDQYGNHAFYEFWLRVYINKGDVFCYNKIPTWYYRLTQNSQHVKRTKDPNKININEALRKKLVDEYSIKRNKI